MAIQRAPQPVINHNNEPLTPSSTSRSQSSATIVTSDVASTSLPYTSTSWDNKEDASEDLERPLEGWPQVAKLIADTPDFEAFPSFKDLNIKSLLYYQAELTSLRKQLHAAEYEENQTGEANDIKNASEFAKDLDYFLENRDKKNSKLCKQWTLLQRIRTVLKEYNAALLQYSQISALPEADPYNVEQLRVWFKRNHYPVCGLAKDTWGVTHLQEKDPGKLGWQFLNLIRSLFWAEKAENNKLNLIVPRPERKVDGLTKWVANEFVPFWQSVCNAKTSSKSKNSDEEKGRKRSSGSTATETVCSETESNRSLRPEQKTLNTYSEARMLRFTSAVATVIACLLPTVAIAILAKLSTTAQLLGVIAVFTAIFATGLMFLTDAGTSRVEIFTATAAFSAVMVVFVQNQNSLTPNGP